MDESLNYCIEVLKTHLDGLYLKLNDSGKYHKISSATITEIEAGIKHIRTGISILNAKKLRNGNEDGIY